MSPNRLLIKRPLLKVEVNERWVISRTGQMVMRSLCLLMPLLLFRQRRPVLVTRALWGYRNNKTVASLRTLQGEEVYLSGVEMDIECSYPYSKQGRQAIGQTGGVGNC